MRLNRRISSAATNRELLEPGAFKHMLLRVNRLRLVGI